MYVAYSLAPSGGVLSVICLCCTLFFYFFVIDRPTYVLYVLPPLSFFSKKWAWLTCNLAYLCFFLFGSGIYSQIITGSSLEVEINDVVSPHSWRGLRLQPVSTAYWVGQTRTGGYVDTNNSIHPKHLSSHSSIMGEWNLIRQVIDYVP
jgi:hypothetical protein